MILATASMSVSNTSEAYKQATDFIEKEDDKVIISDVQGEGVKEIVIGGNSIDIMDGEENIVSLKGETFHDYGNTYPIGKLENDTSIYVGSKAVRNGETIEDSLEIRNIDFEGGNANSIIMGIVGENEDNYPTMETDVLGELQYIQPSMMMSNRVEELQSDSTTIISGSWVGIDTEALVINGVSGHSTEAYFTGKHWIDGKKIYAIDVYYNKTSSGETSVYADFMNNNNVDVVTYFHAHCNDASGRVYPNTYDGGSNSSFNCRINESGSIVASSGSTYPSRPYHVVVRVEFTMKG